MSTLSKPYYNSNQLNTQIPEDSQNGSFKVLSSSLDTPYDTAKRRSQQQQLPSLQPVPNQYEHADEYQIDNNKKKADHHVKLVVVGDGGCGKTCLLISYSEGRFPETYIPTIFDNYITNVRGPSNQKVELALWDTAGQEEYDRLRSLSYVDVSVLLICYAVNNAITLSNVKEKWAPEVKHFCADIPIILVGTKSDLRPSYDSELISFEEAERVANEIGARYHVRCSAKTIENVSQVFNLAIKAGLSKVIELERAEKKKNRFSRLTNSNNNADTSEYNSYDYGVNDFSGSKKRRRHRCVIL